MLQLCLSSLFWHRGVALNKLLGVWKAMQVSNLSRNRSRNVSLTSWTHTGCRCANMTTDLKQIVQLGINVCDHISIYVSTCVPLAHAQRHTHTLSMVGCWVSVRLLVDEIRGVPFISSPSFSWSANSSMCVPPTWLFQHVSVVTQS